MKGPRRSFWIVVLLFFVIGGAVCTWLMDDNNLLQGARDQQEIEKRIAERRQDMIEAFLVGGLITAVFGGGLVFIARKFTNRHDVALSKLADREHE